MGGIMVAHGSDVTATVPLPISDSIEYDEQAHHYATYRAVVGVPQSVFCAYFSCIMQSTFFSYLEKMLEMSTLTYFYKKYISIYCFARDGQRDHRYGRCR